MNRKKLNRIRRRVKTLLREQKINPDNFAYIDPIPDKNVATSVAKDWGNQDPFELFYIECPDSLSCTCEQYEVTSDWVCDGDDYFINYMDLAPGYPVDTSLYCQPQVTNNFNNYKTWLEKNSFQIVNIYGYGNLLNFNQVIGAGTGYLSEQCPGCMVTSPQPVNGNNLSIAGQQNMPENLSMYHDGSCVFEWCYTPGSDNYFCNSTEGFEGYDINFSDYCIEGVDKDGNTIQILDPEIGTVTDIGGCVIGGCTDNGNWVATLGETEAQALWAEFYAGTEQGIAGVLPNEYPGMPGADNYDEIASVDDGTCNYDLDEDGIFSFDETIGCTDSAAFNYYEAATEDDGSCIPVVFGCTDALMFNFNPDANTLCEDPLDQINIINDEEIPCEVCEPYLGGCMDTGALNYNEDANFDDGTCCQPGNDGCMDNEACNYDSTACFDNGTCEYESCVGCTIAGFNGNNPGAEDNEGYYSSIFSEVLSPNPEDYCIYTGCLNPETNELGEYVYQNYVCNSDYASVLCVSVDIDELEGVDIGVPLSQESIDTYGLSEASLGIFIDGGNCELAPVLGCTDSNAENYNPLATEDDGTCDFIFGCMDTQVDENGDYIVSNYQPDATANYGCNYVVCLDPEAENYACDTEYGYPYLCTDGTVNEDLPGDLDPTYEACDDCCMYIIYGCMDEASAAGNPSLNFDPNATVPCTDPPNQIDNDTALPCEPCIIPGCMAQEACNYDPEATSDTQDLDGCEYPPDECTDCEGNDLGEACTDPEACNYVEGVMCDDGSCEYESCRKECANITALQCSPEMGGCMSNMIWGGECQNYELNSTIDPDLGCMRISNQMPNPGDAFEYPGQECFINYYEADLNLPDIDYGNYGGGAGCYFDVSATDNQGVPGLCRSTLDLDSIPNITIGSNYPSSPDPQNGYRYWWFGDHPVNGGTPVSEGMLTEAVIQSNYAFPPEEHFPVSQGENISDCRMCNQWCWANDPVVYQPNTYTPLSYLVPGFWNNFAQADYTYASCTGNVGIGGEGFEPDAIAPDGEGGDGDTWFGDIYGPDGMGDDQIYGPRPSTNTNVVMGPGGPVVNEDLKTAKKLNTSKKLRNRILNELLLKEFDPGDPGDEWDGDIDCDDPAYAEWKCGGQSESCCCNEGYHYVEGIGYQIVMEGTCASFCCGTSYTCIDIPTAAWQIQTVEETTEPGDGTTYVGFPPADCNTDYLTPGDYLEPKEEPKRT